MAGEMTEKDLAPNGEYYQAKLDLLNFAKDMGFSESVVVPFDKYRGPQCMLYLNNLCFASLWLGENGSFIVVVENGRKSESIELSDSSEAYNFILDTWKEWNMGYNPENIDGNIKNYDGCLIVEEDDRSQKYIECKFKDELSCIVEYFQQQLGKHDEKIYYME